MGSSPFLGDAPAPIRAYLDRYLSAEAHFVVRGTFKPNTARCTDGNPDRVPAYTEVSSGLLSNTVMLACFMDVRVNSYILGSGPSELTVMVWFLHYYPGELVYYEPEEDKTLAKVKENALKLGYNYETWLEDGIDGQGQTAGKEAILFVGASHNHSVEAWTQVGLWDIETMDDGTVIAVSPVRDLWQMARPDEFTTHQSSLEMTIPAFTTAVATAHQARVAEYGGRIQPANAKGKKEGVTLPMLETDANRLTQFYTAAGAYAHEDGPPEPAPPVGCGAMSGLSGRDNAGLRGDCTALLTIEDVLRGTATLNWDTGTAIANWEGITTGGSPSRVTKLELPSKSLTGSLPHQVGDLSGLTNLDLSGNSLTGEIPAELVYLGDLDTLKLSGNNFTGCIPLVLEDIATNNDLASLNLLYCKPPTPGNLWVGTPGDLSVPLSWNAVANTDRYRVEYRLAGADAWTLDDDSITSTTHIVDGLECPREYEFRVCAFGSGTTYASAWSKPSAPVSATTTACVSPVFDQESYAFGVSEDAAVGDVVGTVSATDPNGDSLLYAIAGGNEDGKFAIGATGSIAIAAALDHETTASYELTVQATDGTNTADVEVTITVTDVDEPPVFDPASYDFSVVIDATMGAAVGSVSATDDSGNPVSYAVTAGNEAGLFALDAATGQITVAADLSSQAGTTVTLTVEATDEGGSSASVTVTISVTRSCSSGTAVTDPASNAGLVGDCNTLLGLKDALAGTGTLNWSADTAMTSWDGVTLGGTPQRVTKLALARDGLTGVIPAALGDLDKLDRLELANNRLTGSIPAALGKLTLLEHLGLDSNNLTGPIPADIGNLTNLVRVYLYENNLTGPIPPEMGNLTNVIDVWLWENDLTGPIPPELGGMTNLASLWLENNDLSGAIPAQLTGLENLTLLYLAGNNFEGCLPPSLRDIRTHDLDDVGLQDCLESPPAPSGVGATLAGETFTVSWTALDGAAKYEVQHTTNGADAATVTWTALPETTGVNATYAPDGGPACSTEYRFRVRAYGDGDAYTEMWGVDSDAVSVETAGCAPAFDQDSYNFEVAEDAAVGDAVGTVPATDPDEADILTYSITEGNEGGNFAIDGSTGAITVAVALDYETTSEYTLTVEVSDGNGGSDTAAVTVTVIDVAEDAPPAPSGLDVTLADGTFTISWTALDGAAKYEAQHTTDAADAAAVTWTSLPETTGVSVTYAPAGGPACSTEYRFRVRAYGDGETYTEMWGVESDAESVATAGCAPAFDQDSYTFEAAEDAAVDDPVGTVSATDPDEEDTVSYTITAGNTGNVLAIGDVTGAITVAAALDYETTSEYTLTVEASDGNGGTDTVTVTVTVTDVAEDPPPAPSGVGASLADGTFTISWTALDGAAKYEVQHTTDAADAAAVSWTALPETTGVRVTYAPDGGPACSTEYRFRVPGYWGNGDGQPAQGDHPGRFRLPGRYRGTDNFHIGAGLVAGCGLQRHVHRQSLGPGLGHHVQRPSNDQQRRYWLQLHLLGPAG